MIYLFLWHNMNLKKLIYKLSQTDPFVEQIPPVQNIQPPAQPLPPPSPQPLPQPPSSSGGELYPTQLKFWKKGRRYYFQILNVNPSSDVGKILVQIGYKYKYKQFSKEVNDSNFQAVREELSEVSSKTSASFGEDGFEQINKAFSVNPVLDPTAQDKASEEVIEGVLADPSLSNEKKKEIADQFIRDKIEELASMTDEASKQAIIKEFLTLDKSFRSYSFINRLLMMIQNPDVSRLVAGKGAWEDPKGNLKRKIKEGEKPMEIFAPAQKQIYLGNARRLSQGLQRYKQSNMGNQYLFNIKSPDSMMELLNSIGMGKFPYPDYLYYVIFSKESNSIDKMVSYIESEIGKPSVQRYKRIYYGIQKNKWNLAPVYDIGQTEPVGPDSFEKPDVQWQSDRNVPEEQVTQYVNAALKFAEIVKYKKGDKWVTGISVDLAGKMGDTGGWSRGAEIAINEMSAGWRQFSTLIHEIAHSILHFGSDSFETTSKQREIEAESTAYIALQYFGLEEALFAANYLALKGATSQDVLDRYNKIDFAARQIVNGIEKSLGVKQAHSNWFNTIKIAEIFKRLYLTK